MHTEYSPKHQTPIEAAQLHDLGRAVQEPLFVPSPEEFEYLQAVRNELERNFPTSPTDDEFRDSRGQPVNTEAAEAIFTASQRRTWELDPTTRLAYEEALRSVHDPADIEQQPVAVKQLYSRIALGGIATGRGFDEIMQDFHGVIGKSLTLHDHNKVKKEQERLEREWELQGANVAHNRLIMECPELFSHLEQDRHGNLICFQQVTNPDGTVGEVQLSHAEAERLVKYRFELQELRQFDVEEAEEQGAKDRYAAEVNQFRNFQVWVDGGHPAEDWPYIPEETRMSRWDGTQLDKRYFSYSRPDGTFVTTRLRGGNQPPNYRAGASDARDVLRTLAEPTMLPTVFRGIRSLFTIEPDTRARSIREGERVAESRKLVAEIAGLYRKPNYDMGDLDGLFGRLFHIDGPRKEVWLKAKKDWFALYSVTCATHSKQRESGRQIIRTEMAGQNPFEAFTQGKTSPYVNPLIQIENMLSVFSPAYQDHLRSIYWLESSADGKLLGSPKKNKLLGTAGA